MVHHQQSDIELPSQQTKGLFYPNESPMSYFPIQSVKIDWEGLLKTRSSVLDKNDDMPGYLLKPEILTLLDAEKHSTYRLILDLMWTTGARISEVLALKITSFII